LEKSTVTSECFPGSTKNPRFATRGMSLASRRWIYEQHCKTTMIRPMLATNNLSTQKSITMIRMRCWMRLSIKQYSVDRLNSNN